MAMSDSSSSSFSLKNTAQTQEGGVEGRWRGGEGEGKWRNGRGGGGKERGEDGRGKGRGKGEGRQKKDHEVMATTVVPGPQAVLGAYCLV